VLRAQLAALADRMHTESDVLNDGSDVSRIFHPRRASAPAVIVTLGVSPPSQGLRRHRREALRTRMLGTMTLIASVTVDPDQIVNR